MMDGFQGGSGPRVILLHSGLLTWREWRCVTAQLTTARTIVAPTLPGSHGGPPLELAGRSLLETMADCVEALLDELGWTEPVAVVGSSHGAVTGLELAARGRASRVLGFAPPWMSPGPMSAYGALFLGGTVLLRTTWPIHLVTGRSPYASGLLLHAWPSRTALSTEDTFATLRSVRDFPFFHLGPHVFREPTSSASAARSPSPGARTTGSHPSGCPAGGPLPSRMPT